jgi:nucleotide-binding universal stress UspA family protein
LVPLDGSSFAKQALPIAAGLAMHTPAELILLRVVALAELDSGFHLLNPSSSQPDKIGLGACEQAARDLEACALNLLREQILATPVVVVDRTAEAIVHEAAWREVDLIVMATHGYGGLKRWALGGVADKVLHATTTPLVLVRAQ